MRTILAISGSLRAKSFNTMLLHAAVKATPAAAATVEVASIKEIPLYDGDVEADSP
jgi:chromate reductase